jgi:hypothetical protein
VADGALVQVAHPTFFPTPLLASLCRGCEFTLGQQIDWDEVTSLEVSTGPILVDDTELGGPGLGVQIQNPFVLTALDLWQRLLRDGHKITAVSGSDDKLGPDYGTTVTAIYAQQLSRPALAAALRAGHAYVRTRGAFASPEVEIAASTSDGQRGIVGDTLYADRAHLSVHVAGAAGQTLVVTRDGLPAGLHLIPDDDATIEVVATRDASSGPLGTFWRVDTVDAQGYTTIGNPVFLQDPARRPAAGPPGAPRSGGAGRPAPEIPLTGGVEPPLALLLAAAAAGAWALRRSRVASPHG